MSESQKRREESRGNILRNHSWSNGPDSDDELDGENGLLNENISPSHHQSTLNDDPSACNMTLFVEEKMRRKLKFFFMNPIEKWRAKRRFPYKFTVQVIKILLVTVQLCLFAHNNYIGIIE